MRHGWVVWAENWKKWLPKFWSLNHFIFIKILWLRRLKANVWTGQFHSKSFSLPQDCCLSPCKLLYLPSSPLLPTLILLDLHRNSSCPTLCPLTFWNCETRNACLVFFPLTNIKKCHAYCLLNKLEVMDMQHLLKPLFYGGFFKRWKFLLFQIYLLKSATMCVYFVFVQCKSYSPVNFIIVLFVEMPSPPFSVPKELMQLNCSF